MEKDILKIDSNRISRAKGFFIVIDGSDGSGKTTQSKLLIERLESLGKEVAYYDFPQYDKTFFGKMVGRYLSGEFGTADQVNPYLNSLLYAGDRFQARDAMKQDLAAGKIIVCNRYMQSSLAHQGAKLKALEEKEKYNDWLYELEYGVYDIPKPDLVIYLYVPSLVSQKLTDNTDALKRKKYSQKKDIHEMNADFMARSVAEYLRLAEKYPEWRKINCISKEDKLLSIDDISKMVLNIVNKELEIK